MRVREKRRPAMRCKRSREMVDCLHCKAFAIAVQQ